MARSSAFRLALAVGVFFAGVSLAGAVVLDDLEIFASDVTGAAAQATAQPLLVLAIALVTGACEELFFRLTLMKILPRRDALWASTLLYTLVTSATGNLALTLAALMLGAVSGFTYHRTRAWFAPIIIHGLWSITLIGIFPLLQFS